VLSKAGLTYSVVCVIAEKQYFGFFALQQRQNFQREIFPPKQLRFFAANAIKIHFLNSQKSIKLNSQKIKFAKRTPPKEVTKMMINKYFVGQTECTTRCFAHSQKQI
jgi:hypothetical protein